MRKKSSLEIIVVLVTAITATGGGFTHAPVEQAEQHRQVDLVAIQKEEDFVAGFADAVDVLNRRLASLGPADRDTLLALRDVGVVAHLGGDQTLAAEVLQHVVEAQRNRPELTADLAETLVHRGRVARYLGERIAARALYDEARSILRGPGENPRLWADLLQAEASWFRGSDREAATARYRETLALRLQHSRPPTLAIADTRVWLGHWLFRAGRPDEGLTQLATAKRELTALGLTGHTLMGTLLELEADRLVLSGNWNQAVHRYGRAAAIMGNAHDGCLPGFGRHHIRWSGYNGLTVSLLRAGRSDEALDPVARSMGMTTLDFLRMGSWQRIDPESFRSAERLRRRHAASLAEGHERVGADAIRELTSRYTIRSELFFLEQAYLREAGAKPLLLEEVQAHLDRKTAIVGWVWYRASAAGSTGGVTFTDRWAYVIRDRGPVHWIPLGQSRSARSFDERHSFAAQFSAKLRRAATWPLRVPPDPQLDRLAHRLGEVDFAPLLPFLDGVETLLSDQPPGALEPLIVAGRQLIDRFSVAYAIGGLNSFVELMRRSRPSLPETALFVGDTEPGSDRLSARPRLPASAREVARGARLFPQATVLTGKQATKDNLERVLHSPDNRTPDVVHFATHSLKDPRPEMCALLLSEEAGDGSPARGRLEAWEVMNGWELDDTLVVLNGCDTACGNGLLGVTCLGLPQAFLEAGARGIVSNLWPIDDRAAALLIERFYRNLTGRPVGGESEAPMMPVHALAEAKRWLRDHADENGQRPFAHPAYWAGFVLLGSPR